MLKKYFSYPKTSDVFLIIIASAVIAIFYNLKTFDSEIVAAFTHQSGIEIVQAICSVIIGFIGLVLIFLLASLNQILLRIILTITFLISAIALYILNKFGTILDGAMIANALESAGHADEVIDYWLFVYLFFCAVVPISLIWYLQLVSSSKKSKAFLFLGLTAALLLMQVAFREEKLVKLSFARYAPSSYAIAIYEYFDRFYSQINQAKTRHSLTETYKFHRQNLPRDFNVVLIIGESLRADHLGINGYKRDTTPLISKNPNLLNYVVKTDFTTTTRSVTSMLSHLNRNQFIDIPQEKSAVALFKELGFKTYWFSSQSSKEFHNGMLNIMASEADEYFFRDRLQSNLHSAKIYDEALIPHLKTVVEKGGNNFVVLHSFGSHIRVHERYPQNFATFTPECKSLPNSCEKEEVDNSYDNSVLYTDYFINSVIESLRNTKTLLIFVADHGSFLGEDGVYANGGKADENSDAVRKVPMLFYMTDDLMRDHFFRQKFRNAAKKVGRQGLSHDNLFDSLFECAGIDSDLFDRNQSLCQNWK